MRYGSTNEFWILEPDKINENTLILYNPNHIGRGIYMRNNNNGRIIAVYTLTEECENIFPINANSFIGSDKVKVDDFFIRFYIFSEKRPVDGLFSYEKFSEYMLKNRATKFDAEHMHVPGDITKEEINTIIKNIS